MTDGMTEREFQVWLRIYSESLSNPASSWMGPESLAEAAATSARRAVLAMRNFDSEMLKLENDKNDKVREARAFMTEALTTTPLRAAHKTQSPTASASE
jgi:hypothetical protein